MRKGLLTLLVVLAGIGLPGVRAQTPGRPDEGGAVPQVLTTIAGIRALPRPAIARSIPVQLRAVVTYYEPAEGIIFVQGKTGAIFVIPPPVYPPVHPGDRVLVLGATVPGFTVNVRAASIQDLGKAHFPRPLPLGWRGIVDRANDCHYVAVTGAVRSATLQTIVVPDVPGIPQPSHRRRYLLMDIQTSGGPLLVHLDNPGAIDSIRLLDARVRLTGVVGGIFDGKYQQIGAELWVSGADHMRVLRPGPGNPANLPLTPIAGIFEHSYVRDESRRVHVRGSITLYQPGLQMVVETPRRHSVLVNTFEQSPLRIGQVVDVVGFPDQREYSETLGQASVLPDTRMRTVRPVPARWDKVSQGLYPYDLVSMEGRIAAEVYERHRDTLVIRSGAHVFSAILERVVWTNVAGQKPLPRYPIGSRVRVTGVCFVHSGGPWTSPQWFDLEMRTPGDVQVLSSPSWWTVRHLLYLIGALLALVIAAFLWAALLQRKVHKQTEQIRLTMESEASRERRVAQMEAERGRVLEAINSMRTLDEVLGMILALIRTQLQSSACWCELATGSRVGDPDPSDPSALLVRHDIYSGSGERLGTLVLAGVSAQHVRTEEVLEVGSSLAALAIDTRRLYDTLVHRSQYDQLTNAANRFLLESRLEETLAMASRMKTRFALVYIDLDHFKSVNDAYGHRVGDIFLQQVSQRLSEKLRGMDTLARIGGDEFVALIPVVHSRAEVEEIGQRLMRAFDSPFEIDAFSIRGAASIGIAVYPEDGQTKTDLQRFADRAMYQRKGDADK